MNAVLFRGVGNIQLENVPDPKIQKPNDAVVRLTASAICGTDLHMIRGTMAGMKPGTILGHEGVGIVEEVGSAVRNFKPGSCSNSLHHCLRKLLLLPCRLLLTVRQGESKRSRGGHGIFRWSSVHWTIRRPPGRVCTHSLCEYRPRSSSRWCQR